MIDNQALGIVLQAAREDLGVGADEFAAAFNITTSDLSDYENGTRNIPGNILFQIMRCGIMLIVNGEMLKPHQNSRA